MVEVWAERHTVGGEFSVIDASSRNGRTSVTGSDLGHVSGPRTPYTVQFDADGSIAWTAHAVFPTAAYASKVVVDDEGNTYVLGSTPIDEDLFVLKYDATGTLLWNTLYDGGRDQTPKGLTVGSDGRVYVFAQDGDYLLIALDADGEVLWTDRGVTDGFGTPSAVAVDEEGRVFITGSSRAMATTVAYASDGTRLWIHQYPGPQPNPWSSAGGGLSPDGAGGVFVSGFAFSQEANELLLMHYGSEGEPVWIATYPGPPQLNTSARALLRNPAGDLVVVGVSQTSGNQADLLLLGYGTDGTPLWEARHESPPFYPIDLEDAALGPDGEIYVAGWGAGAADGLDFVVARYGPEGKYETHTTSGWSGPGPTPCSELPRNGGLDVSDVSGDVFVAGRSTCGEDFDTDKGAYAVRLAAPATPTELVSSLPVGTLRTYPNPFDAVASITLVPPAAGPATVELFDLLGRRIAILYSGAVTAGDDVSIALSGDQLPNGVYLIRAHGAAWSLAQSVVRTD